MASVPKRLGIILKRPLATIVSRLFKKLPGPVPAMALSLIALCLLSIIGFALFSPGSASGSAAYLPLALPMGLDMATVQAELTAAGLEQLVTEDHVGLPLSDFSAVRMVSASETMARVREGDPRMTPLIRSLTALFRLGNPFGDGVDYRIAYVRADRLLKTANALTAYGALEPSAPGAAPGSAQGRAYGRNGAWLFIMPPCLLAAYLLLRKPRRPVAPKLPAALSWLPFLLFPPTSGLIIMALCALSLSLSVLEALRARMGRGIAQALFPASPYALCALCLAIFEPGAWFPFIIAMVLVPLSLRASLALYGKYDAQAEVRHRPYKPIMRRSALTRQAGTWALSLAAALCVIALGVLAPAEGIGGFSLAAKPLDLGSVDPLADHLAYQEALTYGRLGEASWGRRDYSSLAGRDRPGARSPTPLGTRQLIELEDIAAAGRFFSWSADAPKASEIRPRRLASNGWFFYIMSLAPIWGGIAVCLAFTADGYYRGKIGYRT